MSLQAFIDAMNLQAENVRADYHVTLGALKVALEKVPDETPVVFDGGDTGPTGPHSYRGY